MSRYVASVLFCILLASCSEVETPGVSADKAVSTFTIADGFQIELFAAEPHVADPVAMEIDEQGNIYIAEMHGYPLDVHGSGVIKILSDTNNDGLPDKSSVFADSLVLPMGIMKWKKGIIVIDSPDVIYLEDTDGDGRADVKTKLLTGFALSNPQHNANTPMFGLDNWIYIAHQGEVTPTVFTKEFGDVGSVISFPNNPDAPRLPRNADGRSIRFKPDTYEIEILSGDSQYGHTFDPWGHLIGTSNANHLFQEVIAARYLSRNRGLRLSSSLQMLPDHGDACEIFPTTLNPEHQLLTDVGVITSSCGVTWYLGGAFPRRYDSVTFIAEPVHNLVHADYMVNNGATFTASRVFERKEFLTSSDPWFRPVNFYIGPDGAMYVLDYYRQIIEHPEWMSEEATSSGQLYNGSDKGRIFRISASGSSPADWIGRVNLSEIPEVDLVRRLADRNIWWRRSAQRLLLDRKSNSCVVPLQTLIDTATFSPATVHALWTLEGLGKLDLPMLRKALHHGSPGVRENAIKIAEQHLTDIPDISADLVALQNDPDPKVRFQLMCTLGFLKDASALGVRKKLLVRDIEDYWMQIAALTSSPGSEVKLIEASIETIADHETEGRKQFFENCAYVTGLNGKANDIRTLVRFATEDRGQSSGWWQAAIIKGITRAVDETGSVSMLADDRKLLLNKFTATASPSSRREAVGLASRIGYANDEQKYYKIAKDVAIDHSLSSDYREDALTLMALVAGKADTILLQQLIAPSEPENIQRKSIAVYRSIDGGGSARYVINLWQSLTPAVRDAAMGSFLKSDEGMNILLDAVETRKVQDATIEWPQKVFLMNNDNPEIRKRARALLAGKLEERNEVVNRYQKALKQDGDIENGRTVFNQFCSTCHQVNGKGGTAFGPNLGTIRNREPHFIMADILDPNRSLADGFELWTIETIDGKIAGIIYAETSETITVRFANGESRVIPRSEIRAVEAVENSAMPSGLEQSIPIDGMADLLAFLKRN